jgi:tRNA dimethylallyltransferase
VNNKVFVISGPTASGKTFLAIEIAKKFNGVILNADSCQIYKGLPTLSAQPNANEMREAEHRLYSVLEPQDHSTVFGWLKMIEKESAEIFNRGKNVVVVGGTGMYISRLINGIIDLPDTNAEIRNELNELYKKIGWDEFYQIVLKIDEKAALKINKNDKHRLIRIYEIYRSCGKKISELENGENKKIFADEQIFHINLFPDRDVLYRRCEERFLYMVKNARVIEEVSTFIKQNDIIFNHNTIGFGEIKSYLERRINIEEMIHLAVKETKNYAKRQCTWFRNQFKNVDFLIKEVPNRENCEDFLRQINNKLGRTL